MEKITKVIGAFDKRHPDPRKDYGIRGMELIFILKGELGAVNFTFYTCQHLKSVSAELFSGNRQYNPFRGMAAGINYHSPKPMYDGQDSMECDILPEGQCYCDGSTTQAAEFENKFLAGGDAVVWPMLEQRYLERFGELK